MKKRHKPRPTTTATLDPKPQYDFMDGELLETDARAKEERRKQRLMLQAYEYTLSHEQNEKWDELSTVPSSYSLGLQSLFTWSTPSRAVTDPSHWTNYDITKSLRPMLWPEKKYKAAVILARAIRRWLTRRRKQKKKFAADRKIVKRELAKILRTWHRFQAYRIYIDVEEAKKSAAREIRAYDQFRDVLQGKGYTLSRWSHSKKKLVNCTIKVDRTREYFLFYETRVKYKRYLVQDIQSVTKGYSSPFLKEFVKHKESDKTLSLYFRDRHNQGKEVTIDLLFDVMGKGEETSAADGKVKRNRFFNNFCKLQSELESDDAFYFSGEGAYCRVGKSVFERWERITMMDPQWVRTDRKDPEKGVEAVAPPPGNVFRPYPIPDALKPQKQLKVIYQTTLPDGTEIGATWYSYTDTLNYPVPYGKAHTGDSRQEIVFKKEYFVLQQCIKKPGQSFFVPQWHSSNTKRSAKNAPKRARLMDLKPYFEQKVKQKFGDVGIAGWRNSETGEFEFEDDDWKKLCEIAKKIPDNKQAQKWARLCAREIKKIQDADTPGDSDDPEADDDDAAATGGGPLALAAGLQPLAGLPTAGLPRSGPAFLTTAKKQLLRSMWPDESQQKRGKMWQSSEITYNTAQKNRMVAERREEERKALEEHHKREVEARGGGLRNDGSIYNSTDVFTSRLDLARPTSQLQVPEEEPETPGSDDIVADDVAARVVDDDAVANYHKGTLLEVSVLETATKRVPSIPLGLRAVKWDLSGATDTATLTIRGKKLDKPIELHCALIVADIAHRTAVASISHAWQNQTLAQDDLIVAVNNIFPKKPDDLLELVKYDKRPRAITIFRLPDDAKKHVKDKVKAEVKSRVRRCLDDHDDYDAVSI